MHNCLRMLSTESSRWLLHFRSVKNFAISLVRRTLLYRTLQLTDCWKSFLCFVALINFLKMSVTQVLLAMLLGLLGYAVYWLRQRFMYWEVRGIAYEKPNYLLGNLNGIRTSRSFLEIWLTKNLKELVHFVVSFGSNAHRLSFWTQNWQKLYLLKILIILLIAVSIRMWRMIRLLDNFFSWRDIDGVWCAISYRPLSHPVKWSICSRLCAAWVTSLCALWRRLLRRNQFWRYVII